MKIVSTRYQGPAARLEILTEKLKGRPAAPFLGQAYLRFVRDPAPPKKHRLSLTPETAKRIDALAKKVKAALGCRITVARGVVIGATLLAAEKEGWMP